MHRKESTHVKRLLTGERGKTGLLQRYLEKKLQSMANTLSTQLSCLYQRMLPNMPDSFYGLLSKLSVQKILFTVTRILSGLETRTPKILYGQYRIVLSVLSNLKVPRKPLPVTLQKIMLLIVLRKLR